uniref:Tick transposon n=1 Tax=Ixodes ricinus TaxID=34613 RepID=A0A6B0V913_IXORI
MVLTESVLFAVQAFLFCCGLARPAGLPPPLRCLAVASSSPSLSDLMPVPSSLPEPYLPIDIGVALRSVASPSAGAINSGLQYFQFIGHGEVKPTTMLTESVFFAVRVHYAYCSVRSSNRFLVILPCPGTCMCIMYDCFLVCRLLLCGDVESNLGLDSDCMLDNILKGQAKILNGIDDLKSQLVASDAVIASLRTKVTELERLLQLMSSSTSKIDGLDSTLSLLQSNTAQQTEKLVDLEDRSRRSNLGIYGLPEPNNETGLQLKDHVVGELFEKKLDVKCCSIGRIHRLGRKKANSPVILYLQNYNEKQAILKNAKKTKRHAHFY